MDLPEAVVLQVMEIHTAIMMIIRHQKVANLLIVHLRVNTMYPDTLESKMVKKYTCDRISVVGKRTIK